MKRDVMKSEATYTITVISEGADVIGVESNYSAVATIANHLEREICMWMIAELAVEDLCEVAEIPIQEALRRIADLKGLQIPDGT